MARHPYEEEEMTRLHGPPEERARVIAEANRARLRPLPKGFTPPVLSGGTRWIGGDLRRGQSGR